MGETASDEDQAMLWLRERNEFRKRVLELQHETTAWRTAATQLAYALDTHGCMNGAIRTALAAFESTCELLREPT